MDTEYLKAKDCSLSLSKAPYMVGILNVTPDSFSDGGQFSSVEQAVKQAKLMLLEGATILDIGGESTRPDAEQVSVKTEIERVVPVICAILEQFPDVLISVDTSKSEVASEALKAGACIVNDVTGFLGDASMPTIVAETGAACILMFNARLLGAREDIVASAFTGWEKSIELAERAGIKRDSMILDPGIGFGTSREEDLLLIASLERLKEKSLPVMLGASRKRVTGELLGLGVDERLETTLATTVAGIEAGVEFFRVHDVQANKRAAAMAKLIYDKRNG
ncbi:dihydropteroate synthase [Puniceicoccaceae bacterium K14]|nr:dihydropteroate synthase [Puniceicoccaceae bacterium K14]